MFNPMNIDNSITINEKLIELSKKGKLYVIFLGLCCTCEKYSWCRSDLTEHICSCNDPDIEECGFVVVNNPEIGFGNLPNSWNINELLWMIEGCNETKLKIINPPSYDIVAQFMINVDDSEQEIPIDLPVNLRYPIFSNNQIEIIATDK